MDGPIVVRKHISFARRSRRRGILVATISLSDDGAQVHPRPERRRMHPIQVRTWCSHRDVRPILDSCLPSSEATAMSAGTGGPESDVVYEDDDEGGLTLTRARAKAKANAASDHRL